MTDASSYLSYETTKRVKGIMALLIIVCHIRAKIPELNNTILGMCFTSFGYLSVAMFFFYSGYGLRFSCTHKGFNYIKEMPKKRIVPLYANCIVVVTIYIFINMLVYKTKIDIITIIHSLSLGDTIVEYGWYLHAIILIYILYVLMCYIFKNETPGLVAHLMLISFYIVICNFFKSNMTYYEFLLAFLLGTYWYDNKDKIDNYCKKQWGVITSFILVIFGVTLYIGNIYSGGIAFLIKIVSAGLFSVLICLFLMIIKIPKIPFLWIGERTFEIYVLQGIPIRLLRSDTIMIKNSILYAISCFFVISLLAAFFHPIFQRISIYVQKLMVKINVQKQH